METDYKFCKNCGEVVEKDFCPSCGQQYKNININFGELFSEFFNEIFNVDSKIFKTLKILLFMPGKLSLEYIRGRRTRYISPFRLYLIISVLYFILLNFRDVAYPKMQDIYHDIKENGIMPDSTKVVERFAPIIKEEVKQDSTGSMHVKFRDQDVDLSKSDYWPMFRNSLKFTLFFLLPIVALILKFIYIRQKRKYLEHLIFTIHIHTVIFISLIIMVFNNIKILDILMFSLITVYIVMAMKNFYNQKLSKTIWKYVLVSSAYTIITAVVIIISMLLLLWGIYLGL